MGMKRWLKDVLGVPYIPDQPGPLGSAILDLGDAGHRFAAAVLGALGIERLAALLDRALKRWRGDF